MTKGHREFDIEERLIDFAVRIISNRRDRPGEKNFMIRNSLFDIRYSL